MKWIACNALGGLAWLAGLAVVRGATLPAGVPLYQGEHQMMFGAIVGLAGLAVLIWANIRATA